MDWTILAPFINFALQNWLPIIIMALVAWVGKYLQQTALPYLQHNLGAKKYALAVKITEGVVNAVEQMASDPTIQNASEQKFEMARKRVNALFAAHGINYSEEQVQTLIEAAVREEINLWKDREVVPAPAPEPEPAPQQAPALAPGPSVTYMPVNMGGAIGVELEPRGTGDRPLA